MKLLGYEDDRWSDSMNYVKEGQAYFCFLPAPRDHLAVGYHRKKIGLNHLAFQGRSRTHVDKIAAWVKASGYTTLYDAKYPYAGGPSQYALHCEDSARIKVEVVAPSGA